MASNFYPATGLIGGIPGDLDAIDGTGLADLDGSIVITASATYIYVLDASSNEDEDSPLIISPDTNAGAKRWKLVSSFNPLSGALTSLIYSNTPGAF